MTDTASASLSALGICLEEYAYPYPVRFLPLTSDLQPVAMAYMDIPPAANTAALLNHLGVGDVAVLGHSTGGMTATRFALTYPDRVTHLVLEDGVGAAGRRPGAG